MIFLQLFCNTYIYNYQDIHAILLLEQRTVLHAGERLLQDRTKLNIIIRGINRVFINKLETIGWSQIKFVNAHETDRLPEKSSFGLQDR